MAHNAAVIDNMTGFLAFIEERTGITVPETDRRNLAETIRDRSSSLAADPASYLGILRRDAAELGRFLNRITIGETYFFREERHFRALRETVFPALASRSGAVSIWSATCASGEEAYSLAAIARAFLRKPFTVYASDINTDFLEVLARGEYHGNSFRDDGRAFHSLVTTEAPEKAGSIAMEKGLKEMIRSARVNIFSDDLDAIPDGLGLVFLRNTLIYMKQDAKSRVVERVAKKIAPGGFLFLASSEMPLIINPSLALRESGGTYFFQVVERRSIKAVSAGHTSPSPETPQPAAASRPAARRSPIPGGAREIPPADLILTNATAMQEDRTGNAGDRGIAGFMAILVLYALHFINLLRSQASRDVISIMEELRRDEISWHLRGLLDIAEGNSPRAARSFAMALEHNGRFWPSRFYRGLVLRESDAGESRSEFTRCLGDIGESGDGNRTPYGCLLEGFSEKYFAEICRSMIKSRENR